MRQLEVVIVVNLHVDNLFTVSNRIPLQTALCRNKKGQP